MSTATAFLTGRQAIIGTSLGSNTGGTAYPNSGLYWPGGTTPGWPSDELQNYNQIKALWGRKPDAIHRYVDSISTTTGITGSAGAYGWITSQYRTIMNDGCIFFPSFKYGGAGNWQTTANALNTTTPTTAQQAIQQDFLNFIQNVKRWRDDTGNTAPIKKIVVSFHHEPSNDGSGTGASYVAAFRAIVDFCRSHGLGGGPKPATGPGSAWSGTWYDVLEWCHIAIAWDIRTAAGTYAYYPGDNYVTWMMADCYNWGGGQNDNGPGTMRSQIRHPGVAQPGATYTAAGQYSRGWTSFQKAVDPLRQWYFAVPNRQVLLGIGEWSSDEDVDRFTEGATALTATQVHTGVTHKKGDWFTGALKFARGEAYTAPTADNNVTAGTFGPLIRFWNHFNASPIDGNNARLWYFNTIPYMPGDTTASTVSAGDQHYTYDKFHAMVNDTWFTGTVVVTTPVSLNKWTYPSNGAGDFTVDITAIGVTGTHPIDTYTYHWGDGSSDDVDTTASTTSTGHHVYAAAGNYSVTVTVHDTGGFSDSITKSIVLTELATDTANTPYAVAPYIVQGDAVEDLRGTYNPAVDALETYTWKQGGANTVAASGATETLTDARLNGVQDITLSANCTITLPTAVNGMRFYVLVRQDGGGGNTLAWTGTVLWAGGTAPVQTATASKADLYEFVCFADGEWVGARVAANLS